MTETLAVEELEAVKARQQATWASGDYAVIGTTLQVVGESLCEAVDPSAGWRVLDVAAGNGNSSLAAARRGCDVIATDYVEGLLERARRRADAEGLRLATQVADAEDLPFDDATFDGVWNGTRSSAASTKTSTSPRSSATAPRAAKAGD